MPKLSAESYLDVPYHVVFLLCWCSYDFGLRCISPSVLLQLPVETNVEIGLLWISVVLPKLSAETQNIDRL